jgi:hypothetical protein
MASAGATDAEKCASKKHREAAKFVACRQKEEAKAISKGTTPDWGKCETKLETKWEKLDSKYATECPTTGEVDSLLTVGEAFTNELALLLGGAPQCLGNGVEVGGHCWFLGLEDESCDDVCFAEGLVYSDATRDYAGSDAQYDRNCGLVLSALGVPYRQVYVMTSTGLGCMYCASRPACGVAGPRRRDRTATTSTASSGIGRRACACQQP